MPLTPGGIPVVPFVSVAGFKAHPTYLDLQNLRSGDSQGIDQDNELNNLLIIASSNAEIYCRQPLQAHIQQDFTRVRADRYGRLYLAPNHKPVRRLISYGINTEVGSYNTNTSPQYNIEDNRHFIVQIGGGNSSWFGSLQIGTPPTYMELQTTFTYVAGYTNTVLSANAVAGSGTIMVKDPTGIEPGDVLRIWDPGTEEAVTVAASYTPAPTYPAVATAIPLLAGQPVSNHIAGSGSTGMSVTALPPDAYLAVIYLAQDMLQRPGSAGSAWPGMKQQSSTSKGEKPNSIWQEKAWHLLNPYRDVR